MAVATKKKPPELTKTDQIKFDKIKHFFSRSVLNNVLKILTMEHSGFRTVKAVKNINRVFTDLEHVEYKKNKELEAYLWAIKFFSRQWINGVVDPGLILEGAKRNPEWDNIKESIITASMKDKNIISAPEAKMVFDLIGEALQFGYISAVKDEYTSLLDSINLNSPKAFQEIVNRLFLISQSLLDIKYNTNVVSNKVTFNTSDLDSVRSAVAQTLESISGTGSVLKTGIRRLNTLLSPGYMNGRLYTYLGLPAAYKSGMLLKSALDIRKFNPGFTSKTPGMKPCVLYITMENTFTETIERIWNMSFDDNMANYKLDEAIEKISEEMGIGRIINEDKIEYDNVVPFPGVDLKDLIDEKPEEPNIEVVIKHFSYREISTDDLHTIIQDLKDENMEVVAISLDYIKRIRPAYPVVDNVKLELDMIMNELKAIAVFYDIPVITAHQMNRAASAIVDGAARQGKADAAKMVGREHVGSAWEVMEVSDWVAVLAIEFKPGTNEKYLIINLVKRRRTDSNEREFEKYTYLAHPFALTNGFRLLNDMHLDKVLSLQSLVTDIDIVSKEKTNAAPRLMMVERKEYVESDDYYDDAI